LAVTGESTKLVLEALKAGASLLVVITVFISLFSQEKIPIVMRLIKRMLTMFFIG
jgi:hypothetical protein